MQSIFKIKNNKLLSLILILGLGFSLKSYSMNFGHIEDTIVKEIVVFLSTKPAACENALFRDHPEFAARTFIRKNPLLAAEILHHNDDLSKTCSQ